MHCETDSLLRQKLFIELSIAKVKHLNLICLRFIRPAASLSSSAHIALPRPKALLRMSLFIYLLWTLCSVQLHFLCYSCAASNPPGSPRVQPHTLPRLNIPSASPCSNYSSFIEADLGQGKKIFSQNYDAV